VRQLVDNTEDLNHSIIHSEFIIIINRRRRRRRRRTACESQLFLDDSVICCESDCLVCTSFHFVMVSFGPIIFLTLRSLFCHLVWLAGLQWTHSNSTLQAAIQGYIELNDPTEMEMTSILLEKTNSVALSPQMNYTD
jgi:hypothetical protein